MNKADGQRIAIEFTEKIISDAAAILGYEYRQLKDAAVTTLNQYSTSYPASYLTDGVASTSYYWYGTTAVNWIQLYFEEAKVATGFRWYIASSSYYPLTFTISGSNDGSSWTQLGDTFTGTSTTSWQAFTFTNTSAYRYYRINTLTANSTRLYISEVQLLIQYGNEKAFTISGQEYNMQPEGALVAGSYEVQSVEAYPDNEHAILLNMKYWKRFLNVDGVLTISYDSTIGTLAGYGGPVASFSVSFTPESLIQKPNPHDPEHLELAGVQASGTLTRIYYTNTKEEEHFEIAGITATGVLTHIDDL